MKSNDISIFIINYKSFIKTLEKYNKYIKRSPDGKVKNAFLTRLYNRLYFIFSFILNNQNPEEFPIYFSATRNTLKLFGIEGYENITKVYKEKSRFLEEIKENFYNYFDNYNQTLNTCYDGKNIFSFTSNGNSLDRGLCYISSQNINIPEDFLTNYGYNEYLINLIQYNDLKELKSLLSKKYFNLLKIDDYNKLLNKNIDLSNQEKINLLIDNFIDFGNIFSCFEKSIFVKHFREFGDVESNSLIKDLINFIYEDIEFIK